MFCMTVFLMGRGGWMVGREYDETSSSELNMANLIHVFQFILFWP
jgi:hypothetical protein